MLTWFLALVEIGTVHRTNREHHSVPSLFQRQKELVRDLEGAIQCVLRNVEVRQEPLVRPQISLVRDSGLVVVLPQTDKQPMLSRFLGWFCRSGLVLGLSRTSRTSKRVGAR